MPVLCLYMQKGKEYLKQIGNNIRKQRDGKGISQQELADNANIAKSTVQRIEKGELNPTILVLQAISDSLGIEIADLLQKS